MSKVRLGQREFYIDSTVVIDACFCNVSAVDCAAIAFFTRLEILYLVRFIVFYLLNLRLILHRRARGPTRVLQNGNQFGDEGAKAIAAALQQNSSVQTLELVR